mgnify:CR=1 FL=1
MKDYAILINEFYNYVWDFYNKKNGVYPIATDKIIQLSVNRYLETTSLRKIEFDSVDREKVRSIIEKFNFMAKNLNVKV